MSVGHLSGPGTGATALSHRRTGRPDLHVSGRVAVDKSGVVGEGWAIMQE
ncbi:MULTISPECIES: hypothetical protein [unclassified Cryobacterium]|nr:MULTISPECIES: hypothetical protein [unclassified Cryobacterium]